MVLILENIVEYLLKDFDCLELKMFRFFDNMVKYLRFYFFYGSTPGLPYQTIALISSYVRIPARHMRWNTPALRHS
jgi:hypothetical protein